ncbi:hypothetical protein [Variovorax sp. EBFNA2]|uniref:hypothetical protein n=1 Tax=Variovorax sp. EBFNA2 TaxID=3342097 RepID=UPI0029BFF3B8|nr:hypothetical protein [Variovorax boronicumulans]WPG38743.1 hypothetical protein RZE79_05270 [Variovorax boronicumulans]
MKFIRLFFLAMLCASSASAYAGRGIDRATGQALWNAAVNGRTTTIGTGAGSMKVISPAGTNTSGAAGATNVSGGGTVPVAGKQVPVGFTGQVAKEAIVGGVIGCATGGLVGCALGVGTPLAIAYMSLSGARVNPSTGALELTDPTACTIGPCYYWTVQGIPDTSRTFRHPFDACQFAATNINAVWGWNVTNPRPDGSNNSFCIAQRGSDPNAQIATLNKGSTRPPDSATWYPATPQEVRDALYKNDPAPGIVDELSKYGNITWPLGNVKVTGPSEVKGPKSTSITQSGNKTDTTVSQDSTPLSYSGPTVTAGNTTRTSTTTSTTTNPDGSTSTSTSTRTETTEPGTEGEPQKEEEPAPTDTPLPAVPTLYVRKYPDGLVGIWNDKKAQLNQSQLFSLPSQLLPTGVGGGSCPTWTIPLDMAGFHDWGMADLSVPCWVYDVVKAIVLIGAAILARALIFGG